jgi:hypothetical protein
VVTGLAAAFQTFDPQAIHSIKKRTKISKKPFDLRRQRFPMKDGQIIPERNKQSDYQDDWRRSPP